MEVIYREIQQEVRIRKYEVDICALQECLREHRNKLGIKTEEIADILCIPKTQVDHYFRKDRYFAIPDEEVWFRLKELLGIDTDEFDVPVMTFETLPNVFEKGNRIYIDTGLSPTLLCDCSTYKVVINDSNCIKSDG